MSDLSATCISKTTAHFNKGKLAMLANSAGNANELGFIETAPENALKERCSLERHVLLNSTLGRFVMSKRSQVALRNGTCNSAICTLVYTCTPLVMTLCTAPRQPEE